MLSMNSNSSRLRNISYSLDMCVIVTTGDIAFSGTEVQYLVAMEFLDGIRKLLSESWAGSSKDGAVPIHFVLVPGNHDCDFSVGGEVRPILIESVLGDTSKARVTDIVEACTGVQGSFFEFLAAMEGSEERIASHPDYDSRLCYEYSFSSENSNIRFLCYNTAWLSQLRESQGHLFFPSEAVASERRNADLVIAAFHHPYNWIESNAARLFRSKVEVASDLILTGHEHVASMRTQDGNFGQHNTCVEGGVLQDNSDPTLSEFNVFIFDTELNKQKFGNFRWDGHKYHLTEKSSLGDEGGGLGWTEYRTNDFRVFRRFEPSKLMQEFLDDPGIDLRHRDRGSLKLREVFLYPDLMEMTNRHDRFGQRVAGDGIGSLLGPNSKLLITGDTESGKTCLGKMLFMEMLENGVTPIFLKGTERLPTGDSLFGYIEQAFNDQYDPRMLEGYRQLDKSSRAIIVDDYDKLSMSPSQKKEFLRRLCSSTDRLIMLSHDITADLEELTDPSRLPEGLGEIVHYRIQPFGFAGRYKLAERWMLLRENVDPSEITFIRNLDQVNNTLNTLVGKNYVPSYPVYVLSVLQALDASTPIDFNASTHGYFYELFIRTSLARGRTSIDFDIIASYLAYLAYQLEVRKVTSVTDVEFREIHAGFEAQYDIRRSYEPLKLQLLEQNILISVNDVFKFKYSYLYNYFLASYLRDHITEDKIRATISDISHSVHVESNANILLFLAHLSKDPVVIDELLTASRDLYTDYPAAELSDDIGFLAELGITPLDATYQESDPQANRQVVLAEMDRANPPDDGVGDIPTDEDTQEFDVDDPSVRFITALRHLEILGQVLKNFPGSLEGATKLNIARECYQLGLRALSVVFDMVRSDREEILKLFAEIIKERHPEFTALEVDNRAKETLIGLSHALSYSMIKKIAISVSSRDLSSTFERLLAESSTPAFKLITSALELDHKAEFPSSSIRKAASEFEDAPLPLSVLRHLVVTHFNLFPVDFRTKQSICDTLGIRYSTLQRTSPSPRMLPRANAGASVT